MVDRVLIVAVEEVESCYLSTDGQLTEKPAIQTRALDKVDNG